MRSPEMILVVHSRKTRGTGSTWRKSFWGTEGRNANGPRSQNVDVQQGLLMQRDMCSLDTNNALS
jgi:hypothetical protein